MELIATHDSATGEKGLGTFDWFLSPFSKTQSKTIREQYTAGCRLFDIRIKKYKNVWRCAHGLWKTFRTAEEIIAEINGLKECFISITYEGKLSKFEEREYLNFIANIKSKYRNIIYGNISIKYGLESDGVNVKYSNLITPDQGFPKTKQGFLPLDGRSWHTYIPIPWLWDKLYKTPHIFNDEVYTYVDFL